MGIGTALAVTIPAVTGVTSAAIGAHAAGSAADKQVAAEQKAQDIQTQEWNQQQANEKPFLQTGESALNNLSTLVNDPNFSKYPGGNFSAPTLAEARATPGYKFQLDTGTDALTKGAAATGNLMSGNTGTALQKFGQGLADSTYNQDYARALQTYMTNYGVWNADTSNRVNRLQTLADMGANTAANLGTQGQTAATNAENIAVGKGTASASGTVGAANAITNGLTTATSGISQLPLYALLASQVNNSSYGAPGPITNPNTIDQALQDLG